MDYSEAINNLKESLKSLMTAENTEQITKAVSQVDELEKLHANDTKEITSLKDRIVEVVKNTSFKDVSKDNPNKLLDEPMDMEKSIKENVAKIIKERKK